ncbi:trans-sialidase, putative [Trypanosoma cruzi marinkellei]|uniref:Trans-sialidase, putative n=1 Tax=Trypanosoma cruzi marinkellei TaxID=85056 RepID=K2NXA2_TRYCR|nr:trans-sialidase, putative [Trypanosoma cruzi marinkellei]
MLSRVAAVKAPRTHNRRRVTGSSGRRREGRESERQRPNMSRRVFTFALLRLLVVMMCCNTGGTTAAVKKLTEPNFEWKDITDGVTVDSFTVPGLIKVGSEVFAVAEAQCRKDDTNSFTGIASQILTAATADQPEEVLKDPKDTKVLEEGTSTDPKKGVDVSRPTTVVEGSNIYMLVGKYTRTDASSQGDAGTASWGLLLVKGHVSAEGGKKIQWNDTHAVPCTFLNQQEESWTRLVGGGGLGVHTQDGKLVFPVEGTKGKTTKGDTEKYEKTVSLIITSLQDVTNWKLSKGMSDDGCSEPSVVEWGGKLMMMTACGDGRRRVYEIGDEGDSWTEALGTLSCVWGNKQDKKVKPVRSGFITATIDGVDGDERNVMLVTLPVYSEVKENENVKLHLWVTDNTHIVDIGSVPGGDDVASSLLYKSDENGDNKKLIALYEKKGGEKPSPGMVSVLLTSQLERVKKVLATWREVDDRVSQLCPSKTDAERTSTGNACGAGKITDGLVGFLSGNFSDGTWKDEYLGVNATVTKDGAVQVESGVKLTRRGAGAEWPVGRQGENQLYHFANYNFTLVATVSIDGVPTKEGGNPIPLMGASMNDGDKNTVLLGLSYNSGGKWKLSCGDKKSKELSSPLKPGKTHQLAIVLQNGNESTAYVDGQRVGLDESCVFVNAGSKEISHFYIGWDGGGAENQEDVCVTVTNVLLYNRPLNGTEIGALNPNKVPIPPVVPGNAQGSLSRSYAGQPPLGSKELNKNEGVGGASKSAPSTVTASSGKEKSAIQPPSEISSGVNKNVDVASSSVGGPTVGAEAGDTVQGDRPPRTSAGTPATADANAATAKGVGQDDPAAATGVSVSSSQNGETARGRDEQGGIHSQVREVNATAPNSSLRNLSQGNNSDAGTMRGSGLPLLLLFGLWEFAAL